MVDDNRVVFELRLIRLMMEFRIHKAGEEEQRKWGEFLLSMDSRHHLLGYLEDIQKAGR
jgi:hypothetical protein